MNVYKYEYFLQCEWRVCDFRAPKEFVKVMGECDFFLRVLLFSILLLTIALCSLHSMTKSYIYYFFVFFIFHNFYLLRISIIWLLHCR